MDTKHYGAGYLMDTGDFLKQLKIHSYTPFNTIKEGVVVDLGCGTGMDAINLANMLGHNVLVVGLDHDKALIEHAKTSSVEVINLALQIIPLLASEWNVLYNIFRKHRKCLLRFTVFCVKVNP
jgi:SAM-dependent methyltransferase